MSGEDLLCLEQQDGVVSEVEVDKVFRLVRHEGAEVAAYYAMPCWTSSFIELEGCVSDLSLVIWKYRLCGYWWKVGFVRDGGVGRMKEGIVGRRLGWAYLFLDMLCDVLVVVSDCVVGRGVRGRAGEGIYLLDGEFSHCFLCCMAISTLCLLS